MNVTPRSSARPSAASESSSFCGPQLPPMAQPPKPISETFGPDLPKVRYFMAGGELAVTGGHRKMPHASRHDRRRGVDCFCDWRAEPKAVTAVAVSLPSRWRPNGRQNPE